MATKKRRDDSAVDQHALRELMLWQENMQPLYHQELKIRGNIARKMLRGTYDPKLAPKLWMYLADATSKSYKNEFGSGFDIATRRAASRFWAEHFEKEVRDWAKEIGKTRFLRETVELGTKAFEGNPIRLT